jgi:hypothetical protein
MEPTNTLHKVNIFGGPEVFAKKKITSNSKHVPALAMKMALWTMHNTIYWLIEC